MKTNRLFASVIVLLALALLLGQSAGAGAQTAPNKSVVQNATKPGVGNGFSARLTRPNDQAPYKITFQGRLTNNIGQPITNPTAFSFKLYDAPSGGNLLFTENATITPDTQGLLTYQVGTATAINISLVQQMANNLYLGVTVGSDAEMSPRLELTLAPYAVSLVPGAVIQASLPQASQAYYGVVNGINDDLSDPSNAGLYGRGAEGVSGASTNGYGVFGYSSGSSGSRQSAGVVGQSVADGGAGGVFTTTGGSGTGAIAVVGVSTNYGGTGGVFTATGGFGTGLRAYGNPPGGGNGTGVVGTGDTGVAGSGSTGVNGYAINTSGVGYGVSGSAYGATSSSVGGDFDSYQGVDTNIGLHVRGKGTATGGFSTGLGYGMMVRYDGKAPLHAGDVVAADGNNSLLNGTQILGADKANASNAGAAIGVVHHRYLLAVHSNLPGKPSVPYTDDQATSFVAGDLIEIIIAGQAQMKVDGQVHIGDHLAITASGSVSAAKGSGESIGKVVGLPDKDGYATVFVNLK